MRKAEEAEGNYCNQRYGSITGAYAYWKANSNY